MSSTAKIPEATTKEFTVVMRGPSAVFFREGGTLILKSFPTDLGPVNIVYTSRWLKRSESVTMPGHLWIEIRGNGQTLEEVLSSFANAGLTGISTMSLSANAAIEIPEIEVAFNSTPDVTERDFFQSYVPPETEILYPFRLINVQATLSLLEALKTHSEAERLLRATAQYHMALDSWKIGHSIMVLAHLWIALESLTKVRLRAELVARGLKTNQELSDDLGIELEQLDPTIRRELILKGDSECYRMAKEASEGFEHAFMGFDKLRELAREVRHRMSGHIRKAIFELSGLDDATVATLLSDPFDKPKSNYPLVKYLRGSLVGKGNELAAPENAYPFMRMRPGIKRCEINQDGKLEVQLDDSFTAELAEGISFQPKSYELWEPD